MTAHTLAGPAEPVGARSKARRRALEVLYEAEARGLEPLAVLADRRARSDIQLSPYVDVLVAGVQRHLVRIDSLLDTYADGWSVARMPAVDRNVLRLGSYELLWCDAVPDLVAVDEAVTLVAGMSGDDSPRFVNGLLERLRMMKSILGIVADSEAAAVAEAAGEDGPDDISEPPDPVEAADDFDPQDPGAQKTEAGEPGAGEPGAGEPGAGELAGAVTPL